MSPYVLRRKLQKKKKHRVYGICPKCKGRTERKVVTDDLCIPHLYRSCQRLQCDFVEELFWSGGGIGRHIR